MIQFSLQNAAYIELDKLLKHLQLVNTGGEAHQLITDGKVRVNNAIETQKRKKLRIGDRVRFQTHQIEIIA
jgi:ribosome-associated protein